MFASIGGRQIKRQQPQGFVGEVRLANEWFPSGAVVSVTPTVIPYDIAYVDPRKMWDNVNKRFIPKVAGYYDFSFNAYTANTTGWSGGGNVRVCRNNNPGDILGLSSAVNSGQTVAVGLGFGWFNGKTDFMDFRFFAQATSPAFGPGVFGGARIALRYACERP